MTVVVGVGEAVVVGPGVTVPSVVGELPVVADVASAGAAVPFIVETVVVDSTGESERALQPANSIETTTKTTSTER